MQHVRGGGHVVRWLGSQAVRRKQGRADQEAAREDPRRRAREVGAQQVSGDVTIYDQMVPYLGEDDMRTPAAMRPEARVVADHERGVLYRGPWETYADGFCEHTRRSARALAMAGVPTHLRSISPKFRYPVGDERRIDRDFADLLNASIASYATQVIQTVPSDGSLSSLVSYRNYPVEHQKYINERKAIYTVWERFSGLGSSDVRALNMVGQAWVGCEASATFLKEAGVDEKRLRVVPCPYMPGDPLQALAGRARRKGPVRFYHIGKWEPRKEQRNILGAFLMAFAPGEAMLLLKTSESAPYFDGYPVGPEAALHAWLKDERVKKKGWTIANITRGVFIIARRLTDEQMVDLHRKGDVYVSLSRAEGFDMPAFDSKLAGNLMVYTPSGGPQDFAMVEDIEVPATGRAPCHGFYKWHKDAMYLDYDIETAVVAMREAAELAKARTVASTVTPVEFSAERVGQRMAGYLREMAEL